MSAVKLGTEDVTFSDMISNLPDDLLIRILSLLPISEAMNTSLLSKRWESLWKMMPVLKYVEKSCPTMTSQGFVEFCRRSLQLHEAPVLKTLKLSNYSYNLFHLYSVVCLKQSSKNWWSWNSTWSGILYLMIHHHEDTFQMVNHRFVSGPWKGCTSEVWVSVTNNISAG